MWSCYCILTKFRWLPTRYGVKYKCPTQHSNIYLASTYLSSIILHYTPLPEPPIFAIMLYILTQNRPLLFSFHPISTYFLSLQWFSPSVIFLSVYLLENQLKPASPEALPNLPVGINLFFKNVQWPRGILNWSLHESIAALCLMLSSLPAPPKCFLQDEILKNLIKDLAKCLFLLCQPIFTCLYRTHSHLKQ